MVESNDSTIHAVDPRSGEILEPGYQPGSAADVDRAANAAAQAFRPYRQLDAKARAEFLDAVADGLTGIAEEIVAIVGAETGIAEPRIRGELGRTTNQLRLFAGVVRDGSYTGVRIETALPDRTPLPRPDLRQHKIPLGPVAVFGASNFPLAFSVAGGDTASALAAGCPVVVKAHPSHPGTSELVAGVITRTAADLGLPAGVFSMVHGGVEVGTALVQHPAIKAVGFTGSRAGGLALLAVANARPTPIPVYAEMSSINPVVLLPGALAERGSTIGQGFVGSLTTGVGQLCTNPGLVFAVDSPALQDFLDGAADAVQDSAAAPMLSAGICAAYDAGVQALREHPAVEEIATGADDQSLSAAGVTHLFTTTAEAFSGDPALSAEVFGASSLIVRVPDAALLPELLESLEGQLTATIHLAETDPTLTEEDLAAANELLPILQEKVGRIVVNGWPTGVDVGTAMVHGGPFPATSDGRSTSVGTLAIDRFLRPLAYQDVPSTLLPPDVR